MQVLVLSEYGDGWNAALRMFNGGNTVEYFQRSKPINDALKDMVLGPIIVDEWRSRVGRADLVLADSPYFSYRLANMELNGQLVLYVDSGLSYKNLKDAMRHFPVPAVDFLAALVNGDVEEVVQLAKKKRWWRRG